MNSGGWTNIPDGVMSMGVPLTGCGMVPYTGGNTYWVKKATDTDYGAFCNMVQTDYEDGTQSVYSTADSVFAVAGKNDRIIFMTPDSGGHDLTETITITQHGLRVYGDSGSPFLQRTMIKLPTTATDTDMFLIKADKVQFYGLTLQNRKAGKCVAIGDTAGQAYYQIHFLACNFTDYGGVATYGISPGNDGDANNSHVDPVNLVVERCVFDGFVTAAINANGTRDAYLNNFIRVAASAYGIHANKHTDSRGYGFISGNYILGNGTGDTGIYITDVGSAANLYGLSENKIQGCNATITTQTNLQGFDNNSAAAATGTKTAIDIVT